MMAVIHFDVICRPTLTVDNVGPCVTMTGHVLRA